MAETVPGCGREGHQREKRSTHHGDAEMGQLWRWLHQGYFSQLVPERNKWQAAGPQQSIEIAIGAVVDMIGIHPSRYALMRHLQ